MTTLADVNATLGVTNIALSKVASNQEETTQGIQGFLDYLEGKDKDDRRREIESDREDKTKASVLSRAGAGAAAIGGGLATAGKSAFGFGKGLFSRLALPAGLVGGFLTSLLSSKLLKAGLAGLGLFFGDEIAEYLLGDNAKKEVKEVFGNVIKGAAVGGFLFGKKGFLVGGALTALLQNKKVDEELGRLVNTVDDFAKKIGFDGLLGVLKKIGDAVGSGLKGLNDLADGKVNFESIKNTLGLLAGAAFLVSPIGSTKLALAAAGALIKSPAGLALLALAAGGAYLNKVMGNEISDAEGFLSALGIGTAGFLGYGAGKNLLATTAEDGMISEKSDKKTSKPSKKGTVSKLGKGSVPSAGGRSPLARMMSRLVAGVAGGAAKMGIFAVGASTVLLPLAAIGLTEAYFGDALRDEAAKDQIRKNTVASSAKQSKQGADFYGGVTVGFVEDFVSGNKRGKVDALRGAGGAIGMAIDENNLNMRLEPNLDKLKISNSLENYFAMRAARKDETTPPGVGPSVVNNSGNTNTTNVGNQIVTQDGVSDKKMFENFRPDAGGIL